MNKNKFRFWNPHFKDFQDCFVTPIGVNKHKQFLGILDSNMKEIYEDDVVKFVYSSNESKLGVIEYMDSYCAYVIHYNNGYVPIMNIFIDSLEIVGNLMKDYIWSEEGDLIKYERP